MSSSLQGPQLGARLRENVARAVKAPDQVLRDVLVAFLAEGHVLIEDYPGVGKTALARALARSIDAEYARVQCTADLLPADVVGANVYNQRENRFEFRPGPVFANIVLVDEVNRASPKTQSGLLECMQERHVTVDSKRTSARGPFFGGHHNPVEYEGTYRCLRRSLTASWCGFRSAPERAGIPSAGRPAEHDAFSTSRPCVVARSGSLRSDRCMSEALRATWSALEPRAPTPGSISEPHPAPG